MWRDVSVQMKLDRKPQHLSENEKLSNVIQDLTVGKDVSFSFSHLMEYCESHNDI